MASRRNQSGAARDSRDYLGGAQDDEERVAVHPQPSAAVGAVRIFDREVVKTESSWTCLSRLLARLVQADPDEPVGQLEDFANAFDLDALIPRPSA